MQKIRDGEERDASRAVFMHSAVHQTFHQETYIFLREWGLSHSTVTETHGDSARHFQRSPHTDLQDPLQSLSLVQVSRSRKKMRSTISPTLNVCEYAAFFEYDGASDFLPMVWRFSRLSGHGTRHCEFEKCHRDS